MDASNFGVSVCRYCQNYRSEGRRGGHCQQLGAQVQSDWKACSLAIPPFASAWENFEEIFEDMMVRRSEALKRSDSVAID